MKRGQLRQYRSRVAARGRKLHWELLELRLPLHHEGGHDQLAYVQMYGNSPEIAGLLAAGPLGTISASPITQGFTYTTQANGLPILNSYPSAPAAIYFDVDGDTNWGGVQPYNTDSDPSTFSATEQQAIVENWWELSMYFSMFNVNVTTIKPTVPMAWVAWGANPTTDAGLSGVDVFPNSASGGSQSLAGGGFNLRIGDTLSHEVGHNFGNWHASTYDALGNRIDEYGVAPDPLHGVNMGNGPSGVLIKWNWGHSSLGGSVDPTRIQDDMAVIAHEIDLLDGSGDGYKPDDYAGVTTSATPLVVSGVSQAITGVIERVTDADAFSFTSTGGRYSIVAGRDYPAGVDLKVSVYNSTGQLIAQDDGDPRALPYTMVNDSHFALDLAAGTYFIVVQSHGNYDDQGQYVVRVDPLPGGWQGEDVGLTRLPGYDSFNSGTSTYTVAGSGSDIAGSSDEFHYTYQMLTGDGSITVKVASQENTNSTAKAGVMIRESLAANAKSAFVGVQPNNATLFRTRASIGGSSTTTNGPTGSAVKWLRLTRTGNTFLAETSTNGTSWSTITSRSVTMNSTVYVGMATTSRNVVALSAATFTGVALTGNLSGPSVTLNPSLTAPGAPTVTAVTSTTVSLSWTASTGATVTGYTVERSADNATFTQVGTTAAGTTTFNDASLSDAQRYFYRIRAQSAAGVSNYSTAVSGVTRAGAVSNLRVIAVSTTQLTLDWTDASGETGFRVDRSTDGTNWTTVAASLAPNTPIFNNNSGLTANTQYFYRVATLDALGEAALSAVANNRTRLSAITNLTFTSKASNQMALSWTASSGATAYKVERSTDATTYTTLTSTQATPSFTDTTVTPTTAYYYRVTALSSNNSSVAAGPIFSATPSANALPAGWTSSDLGSVGGTGAADLSVTTSKIVGGGADIWGTSDQFRFTYTSVTSDNFTITARVTSVAPTNYYSRAGVMIRTSTATGSKFVDLMVHQTDAGVRLQSRAATNGGVGEFNGTTNAAPQWIRLTRNGTSFVGESSVDGVTWVSVGSTTVNLAASGTAVLVGFALTPRDNTFLNTATIDNFNVSTLALAAPTGLAITAKTSNQMSLSWNAVAGATNYTLERSTNGTTFTAVSTAQTGTTFTDTSLTGTTLYTYRVTALRVGGKSPASSVLSAMPAVGAPALATASDTGSNTTDRLTMLDNSDSTKKLSFSVTSTISGATVTLYDGATAIGSAVASGAITTVTTNGTFDLTDGSHTITAKQTQPGQPESGASSSQTITIDTVAPSAPLPPDLQAASDNGANSADNITSLTTLTFGVSANPFFRFYRGSTLLSGMFATGTTFTAISQPIGVNAYSVSTIDTAGNESLHATVLNVTIVTQVTINDISLTEGNAPTNPNLVFTVSLAAASASQITVNYTTVGVTATAGADYTTTTGTLTFAPGVTTQPITVPTLGDELDENDETFVVNLSGAVNAEITDAQGIGTILDNDPAPTIAIGDASVLEGNDGTTSLVFTVSLSGASGKSVTVQYATANSGATAGEDYTSASGSVSFAPGSVSQPITINVQGDTTVEADETFVVNLSGATNATIGDNQATGTIQNDDSFIPPVVSVTTDDGAGSLRQAIIAANTHGSATTITFSLPTGVNTIQLLSNLPAASVPIEFSIPANTTVEVGTASASTLGDFGSLTKSGAGGLVLGGTVAHAAPSTLTVSAGNVVLAGDGGSNLSVNANGGVTTFTATQHLAGLTVAGGARAELGVGRVLVVNGLSIAASGQLDLANGQMIVHATAGTKNAVLSAITAALTSGYGAPGAHWQGNGIHSSTAATDASHLTAVGVLLNQSRSGALIRSQFAGETVDVDSILVRHSYVGDADLSGLVDSVDYAFTDSGYNFQRTGWRNGDFDYSGAVDGADYAMIDNAFNQQGSPLAAGAPQALVIVENLAPTSPAASNASATPAARDSALLIALAMPTDHAADDSLLSQLAEDHLARALRRRSR